jgi:hypothetical protein
MRHEQILHLVSGFKNENRQDIYVTVSYLKIASMHG